MRISLLQRVVSPCVSPVGALGELRWLHLYRLTPDLVGLLLFAGCLWCSGRCFLFTVRHSARIHGDHLVSFTASCVSPPYGVVPWTLAWRVTGWTYCPPPRYYGTVICSDLWSRQSGPDASCDRHRVTLDLSPSISVVLTPLLLRYAWWSSQCIEAGLTSLPVLALPGLCLMPDL